MGFNHYLVELALITSMPASSKILTTRHSLQQTDTTCTSSELITLNQRPMDLLSVLDMFKEMMLQKIMLLFLMLIIMKLVALDSMLYLEKMVEMRFEALVLILLGQTDGLQDMNPRFIGN